MARKAADLKKALEETVQAQEKERQRIARDVHDGLNQLLIGALLELTSGQKRIELGQLEAARESLESSQSILRSVETEIRRVVHDLHPPMLEGLGLPAAIRRLCEQFESYSGMSCRTFVDGETARMPGHAEITVYRIAQEALHNVLVHARAEKVEVDLLFEPDGLRLEVRDNGDRLRPRRWCDPRRMDISEWSACASEPRALVVRCNSSLRQGSGTTVRALVPLPLTR